MSGNPVRIGDGCATVTGYKFQLPSGNGPADSVTDHASVSGRREQGLSPKSGYRLDCARHGRISDATDFSDKEKDEASLPIGFRKGSSNAFILRFAGV